MSGTKRCTKLSCELSISAGAVTDFFNGGWGGGKRFSDGKLFAGALLLLLLLAIFLLVHYTYRAGPVFRLPLLQKTKNNSPKRTQASNKSRESLKISCRIAMCRAGRDRS